MFPREKEIVPTDHYILRVFQRRERRGISRTIKSVTDKIRRGVAKKTRYKGEIYTSVRGSGGMSIIKELEDRLLLVTYISEYEYKNKSKKMDVVSVLLGNEYDLFVVNKLLHYHKKGV